MKLNESMVFSDDHVFHTVENFQPECEMSLDIYDEVGSLVVYVREGDEECEIILDTKQLRKLSNELLEWLGNNE